jgi:serine/threonine protein kinase
MTKIDDVEIIKKLGTGTFGISYLVKKDNKEYVLKIQKILYSDKKLKNDERDYKEQFWREIDLHEFINTLDKIEQIFFTKLYDYKIYNNCDTETPVNIQNNPFFKKLSDSKWCIKYLLEYKEGITLKDFLLENTLTEKEIYSILLQVCKIILILYNGGYSHNDLHLENIIINKTKTKYFNFFNKQIPYNGYQISVIDYGLVLHKKFGKYKYYIKSFLKEPEKHIFNEMFNATYKIINNYTQYINDCTKAKKKLPWERKNYSFSNTLKQIILNHPEFYKITKNKYLKMYPDAKRLLNYFNKNIETKEIYELYNKKNYNDFFNIINRIQYEFHVLFPKKYAKYDKWCSYYEHLLQQDIVLNLFQIDNYNDYIKYLIDKCLS